MQRVRVPQSHGLLVVPNGVGGSQGLPCGVIARGYGCRAEPLLGGRLGELTEVHIFSRKFERIQTLLWLHMRTTLLILLLA